MHTKLSGWGNNLYALTCLRIYKNGNSRLKISESRGGIPRGLGRSYGDSALNSGGVTFDSSELKKIEIQKDLGIAIVGGGVTIYDLECASLPLGFFPAVVPGTAQVTIGGAIASDIHGKSHHKVGSFSNHLAEIKLATYDGSLVSLSPENDTSQLFWATVGGMGLTGLIVEATIRLTKVDSAFMEVTEKRVKNLDELINTLTQLNQTFLYTVAWVDLSGEFKGRGIISAAKHATVRELSSKNLLKRFAPLTKIDFAIHIPFRMNVINRLSIRLFNLFWYHKPLGKQIQHVQRYMHPLDSVRNWNIIYGRRGFIQYQFVIPPDRVDILKTVLTKLKDDGCGSFLSVLKSFGEDSKGLLAFPMTGWTLAIDFPKNQNNLTQLLRSLDQLVTSSGGRVYLTKDSRLNYEHLPRMYPLLDEWKSVKYKMDPDNFWQSDQGRRLKLC
jgi:decaprenylphospho-beta-D-ribofuranose 2-oxidase